MAYRLRYQVNIDHVGAGEGPMTALAGSIPPGGGAGNLTLEFSQNPVAGPIVPGSGTAYPGGNALASADITALLSSMSTDLSTQLNAALARLAQWPQGGAGAV